MANTLTCVGEERIFDGGPVLISICLSLIRKIISLLSSKCRIPSITGRRCRRNPQVKASNRQLIVLLEIDDSLSLVSDTLEITPKSTTDRDVVNLIGCTLPASWNSADFLAGFGPERSFH